MTHYDVIIVGSGIAALAAAKELCEKMNILIITKTNTTSSNSHLAQGGIACAIGEDDDLNFHYADTVKAGCRHNKNEAVKMLVTEGKNIISSLIEAGLPFDRDAHGNLLLGKEGAHSYSRIIHAGGDATGRHAVQFFLENLQGRVQILENQFVCDVVVKEGRAVGIVAKTEDEQLHFYSSSHVILATGGCGQIYDWTSNHPNATGDGLAMAFRAGCRLVDMEFTQFHPTMLSVNDKCNGLISEAVRGEGAILVDETGERFMAGTHPMRELAPRDVVARAIYRKRKKGLQVFLDISRIPFFRERFPTISQMCTEQGINLDKGMIPVSPGMHFLMGGIETDLVGRTNIAGLYAVGEAACTGAHGANRLASNSLLEGLVFGTRAAKFILKRKPGYKGKFEISNYHTVKKKKIPEKAEIRQVMTNWVGIERKGENLARAVAWFEQYVESHPVNSFLYTIDEIERINMLTAGYLIAKGALQRTESRGGHFRTDYPAERMEWEGKRIVLTNQQEAGVENE